MMYTHTYSHREAGFPHLIEEIKGQLPLSAHPAGRDKIVVADVRRLDPSGLHLRQEVLCLPTIRPLPRQ